MNYNDLVKHVRTFGANTSRVLLVSHKACMDGCVCEIIAKNIYQNVDLLEIPPQELKSFLKSTSFKEYDLVIISDVSLYKDFGFRNPKVIFVDHHESSVEFSNNDFVYVNQEYCASVLLKTLLQDAYSKDLSYLNELIKVTQDYDLWQHKDPRSQFYSWLFFYYWNEKFINRFFSGNLELNDEEKEYLKNTLNNFKSFYRELKIFKLTKIRGCIAMGDKFINESCYTLLKEEGFNIVFYRNQKNGTVSIRSNIEGFHVGKYLSSINIGGGHKEAGAFKEEDVLKLQEKLRRIEKYLFDNFKEIRII